MVLDYHIQMKICILSIKENCMDYTTRPWNSQTPNDRNFNTLSIMYGGTVTGSDNNNVVMTNNSGTNKSSQKQPSSTYQPLSSVFDSDKQQQQQNKNKNDENNNDETKTNDNENNDRHRRQRRFFRHSDNTKYNQRHLNHNNDNNSNNIPDSVYRAWYEIQNQLIYNTTSQQKRHLLSLSSTSWNHKSKVISSITNHYRHSANRNNNYFMESYAFHVDNGHSIRIRFLKSSLS